jgi:hypothetical protein
MEAHAVELLLGGVALAALAWIWLVARAFGQSVWWGLGCLVLPPLLLVFALRHAQRAVAPLVLFVLGGLLAAAPGVYSLVVPVDLGLREQLSEGPKLWSLASAALRSNAVREWMERRANYLEFGGGALAVLAWIWLIVRAFRQRRAWGWGTLLVPPLVGLVFAALHRRKAAAPLLLCALGVLVAAVPALYINLVPPDLGPYEKLVDGQRHLTLTGWDRKGYSFLRLKPDVVVLQMANPDVTDQVLEDLKEMKVLQELDLNGTQVTDAGLKVLKDLPALAKLRLARTKITDHGFHDALSSKDSLMELDLSGTQVSRETARAWRDAKPGRRVLQ